MHLDVRGHPLHTRALGVTLRHREDGRIDAVGELLDLRKRGFVPVGGDLQPAGIIHQMRLEGIVEPDGRVLESIRAAQPAVAFEATAVTGGESCRDPIAVVEGLAGSRLDAGFPRRVSAVVGGPRGCNHILTLAHLLGSTTAWALDDASGAPARARGHRTGERLFRRDLMVDGHETADGRLVLGLQLGDLSLVAAPPVASPMARFGGHHEVRAVVAVDMQTFTIVEVQAGERHRAPATLDAAWVARPEAHASLAGQRLGSGITAALLGRFGDTPRDRPLLDGLLMLAPTLVQCMAALSDAWPAGVARNPTLVGIGGVPDSCYMWRREGALARTRAAEGAEPPPRPGG